jgi:copper oxidase (laccase) domain-containing protein
MSDNAEQVKSFGIKERNIEMNGLCTYNEAEVLHSYRRDGERSGRMFAVIGMKL